MTFTEISTEICELVGLSSTTDVARVGRAINRKYREITASLGIKHTSRRATVQATMTIGISTLAFTSAEKVVNVFNRNVTPYKQLDEVTIDELEATMPFTASDTPTLYAIKQIASDSVTILVNCTPQTAFALYADVYSTAATLSGTDEPVFSESYHDILIAAVMIDEYLKLEKVSLSNTAERHVEKRMGELRHWIAVSTTKQMYQGKQKESGFGGSGISGGSGGGSSANGALSYTQTGNIHFDRSGAGAGTDPFTVAAGSGKVDNLDADLLDGLDSTAFASSSHHTRHESGGADAIKLDDLAAPDDNTDLDASITKHGLLKKLPNTATTFLDGTGAFDTIKESDLVLTDIVTNNVSSTAHGLAPKSPAAATQFLNGAATPAFALVKDSDLSTSDIVTNDVTTAKHGFVPKAPNDTTKFLRGDATWAANSSSVALYVPTITNAISSAAEITILDWSIPGSDVADGDRLYFEFFFLAKNNKGTSGTTTFKINIGASAQLTLVGAATYGNSATEYKAWHYLSMARVGADLWVNTRPDVHALWNSDPSSGPVDLITPANWTSTQSLQVKCTLSAADATFYVKPQTARLYRFKAA